MNELLRDVSVDKCPNRQIVGLVTGIMPRDGEATGRVATIERALAPSLVSKGLALFSTELTGRAGKTRGASGMHREFRSTTAFYHRKNRCVLGSSLAGEIYELRLENLITQPVSAGTSDRLADLRKLYSELLTQPPKWKIGGDSAETKRRTS